MSVLSWQIRRNLENSLVDFLSTEIFNQNIKVLDENGNEQAVQVRVGWKVDENWSLPVISIYIDSKIAPRLSIGSNKRQISYLIIIDIRALDEGSRMDLAEWVENTINDGWFYYDYTPNPSDPANPIKTQPEYVSINFISSNPIRLGDNVDKFDKYRHNISIECVIQ